MRSFPHFFSFILVVLLSISFSTKLEAQSRATIPHWEVRTGIGVLPTFLKDHSQNEVPPVSLELRYRANAKFSMGLLAGNSVSQAIQDHHSGESRRVRNDFRMIALRGAVHSSPFEKWEIYGGIYFGYSQSNVSYMNINPEKDYEPEYFPTAPERNGLLFSGFVGSNYQVYKNINIFGELGYGLSLATLGTSVRF